ncbi:MAG: serpin family protein [bacterium]
MKIFYALLCIVLFSLGGCLVLTSPDNGEPSPLRPLTASERAIVYADNSFCFKFMVKLNATEKNKNVFISPLSISMALGMTLNGAAGSTRDSMQRALEFTGLTQQEINESYKSLIALLTTMDATVQLQIANSIWHRPELSVLEDFKSVNRMYFNAEVNALNFSDPSASKTINGWVAKNTKDRITSIVPDQLPRDAVMYLINAIYFKGTWTYQFDPAKTTDALFTRSDGSKKDCKLMVQHESFPLLSSETVDVIDLPYGKSGFSMMIVLPKQGIQIDEFISQMTQQDWIGWSNSLNKTEVDVYLPKFKLEYEKVLNDQLSQMGMGIAFTPWANFTNIDKQGNLAISEVKHKSFIEVNEEGTEAAAATSVGIIRTSLRPVFRVDRPFIFAIRENNSGTILFFGKIVDPTL